MIGLALTLRHWMQSCGSLGDRASRALLVRLGMLSLVVFLTGCNQDVYTDLTEVEANQMLGELVAHGIATTKTAKGKEGFTISVDNNDMLRALAVLKDAGFPRSTRDSIGKVFQKSGIMSSPFEERVRYIYALGEEVAQTISNIDGVVTARVHIVLPDAPQLGQPVKPSSAAVFIKYKPGVDIEYFVPQIRRLVSSSIEGLDYAAVTVVLDEAIPTKATPPNASAETTAVLPGLAIKNSDLATFWMLIYVVGGVLALLVGVIIGGLVWWWRKIRKPSGQMPGMPVVEPS